MPPGWDWVMANRFNEYWCRRRAQVIELRGGRCERCGSSEDLEMAHVAETGLSGRSRGRKERVTDWLRNPSSYRLLCRGCHDMLDAGVLDGVYP